MNARRRFDALVRELVAEMERHHAAAVSRVVSRCEAFADPDGPSIVAPITLSLEDPNALDTLERAQVIHALTVSRGVIATASAMLGCSRKGLYLKRRRLGLLKPEPRTRKLEPTT